jgi:hypothetical protein
VDPNPLAIAHGPVSGFPDIIIAADVITGAACIVWPVANLHRDRSRVTIARVAIPGVAVAGTVAGVTRTVARIAAVVLVSTSPCSTRNTNEQNRKTHPPDCPLPPEGSRLWVINDVHLILYSDHEDVSRARTGRLGTRSKPSSFGAFAYNQKSTG